mmetsp:Transcript_5659/g.13719  ORF Transcript_5659/g.13719 Transcript_5659/m.13719 type:complete len:406 (-) Transcript_5659:129-1346(-)
MVAPTEHAGYGSRSPMGYQGMLPGGLSSDDYLDRRLRPLDAEHYSAAGLLPYRRRLEAVEVLVSRERPWNSFTQAHDPTSWNFFGGKRVPRQERSAELTAVRSFIECVGQAEGAPDQESLYGLMQKSFVVWYPMGKFALVLVEVPEGQWEDLPAAYSKMKQSAGPQDEFRILPMGIKKWNKQIDEIAWLPGSKLTEQGSEVADLVGSMLQISGLRDFLSGASDPAKALPEGAPVPPPSSSRYEGGGGGGGKSGGKGGGGKGFGGGKGSWKGGGGGKGGMKGYDKGMMMGGMGGMPMSGMPMSGVPMGGKGPMPMMYGGGKGMPVMAPMVYPQIDLNSAEMQRQIYGEQLYVLVQPMSPSPYLAQKITGMLLELPSNELLLNLTNREELQRRVREALDVLREDGVA